MGKEKFIKICDIVAFIFALSFALKLIRDALVYRATLNSAPFYIWVIADAAQYLMPALFAFLAGRFLRHRKNKEDKDAQEKM